MKTEPLYLHDSYAKEMESSIVEVKDDGNGVYRLILDKTVFYPMGGGQPTDQGVLKVGETKYDVYQVMLKDGEIWHYIKTQTPPAVGTVVHGSINWDRRYKNMRVHSAGHVVDFAIFLLGYSPKPLMPFKGDHGKKPFIVYQGTLTEDIQQKLQEKSQELVQKDLKFSIEFQTAEDLQKEAIYLQSGLPTHKPLRTLRLETVGAVADGGTQVARTKEVGSITITGIQAKDGNTAIYYSV